MLLKQKTLEGIAGGGITLAFRRWKRPTVKAGGSLRTVIGVLASDAVDLVDEPKNTKKDVQQAGYASREELLAELNARKDVKLYRIALHHAGADARHALRRQADLADDEINDLNDRPEQYNTNERIG